MPSTHQDQRLGEDTTPLVPSCVPKDTFCQTLYCHAQTQPTAGSEIFLAATSNSGIDPSLLFAASMFHDMGTCAAHDHDQRFEVCGADAAVDYMQTQGMSDSSSQRQVWEAIALHTSLELQSAWGL